MRKNSQYCRKIEEKVAILKKTSNEEIMEYSVIVFLIAMYVVSWMV